MPSNVVWSWPLHSNSNISYIFIGKNGLNRKRGHAIIGFNHGLQCYVKNMALGPQSRQKPRPTASVFVYLSPSGHVFNIAWQAMIKTYNTVMLCSPVGRFPHHWVCLKRQWSGGEWLKEEDPHCSFETVKQSTPRLRFYNSILCVSYAARS